MNWFRHYGLGFHTGEWFALGTVILLALVGIALLKLVFWFLKRKRDTDENESERSIGAYMEDKRAVSTQESFVLSTHLAHNFCALSTDGHDAEQEHRKKASRMSSHFMREAS